jgi:hypothetical protein
MLHKICKLVVLFRAGALKIRAAWRICGMLSWKNTSRATQRARVAMATAEEKRENKEHVDLEGVYFLIKRVAI